MKKAFTGLIVGICCWAVAAASLAETKYAVCVGINKYSSSLGASTLHGCVNDATYFYTNLVTRGGWQKSNMTLLTDSGAKKDAIRKAISNYAAKAVSGDTFIYQHSSHGGQNSGTSVFLCSYNDYYEDTEVAADLASFAKGVKVVMVVDACHSGGLFKDGNREKAPFNLAERVTAIMSENRAQRLARGERGVEKALSASEIGWVTAADYTESSLDGGFYDTDVWMSSSDEGNVMGGVFLGAFTWAWWNGSCDTKSGYGDNDQYADPYECWAVARETCKSSKLWGSDAFNPQCTNTDVLRSVELGWVGDEEPSGVRFASIPEQSATVGEALSYTLVATNSDGSLGAVKYSIASATAPAGSYSLDENSGAFSFTPAADGTFEFGFLATNSSAGTFGKARMTVAASLAAPADLFDSGVNASSFTANWGAVAGAASYLLDVASSDFGGTKAKDGDIVLSEDFAAFTGTSADRSSTLDEYLTGTGWTGSKVFENAGSAKLGSSSYNGWIATPEFDLSSGGTVSFDLTQYGSTGDGNTVSVSIVSEGAEDTIGTATPGATETVEFTIPAASASTSVKIATSAKRAIIDNLVISSGGGADILSAQPVAGTSFTVEALETSTYYWRVRAVGNAKGPFSEVQEVTLNADPTAPPSIRAIDDIEIEVGETATATVKVSAPEEAPITSLAITAGDAAAKLGEDGVFTFAPESVGVYPFTITAVNANGSATEDFTVTATLAEPETPEVPTFIDSDAFTAEWTAVPGAESYELVVIEGKGGSSGGGGEGNTVTETFANAQFTPGGTAYTNQSIVGDLGTWTSSECQKHDSGPIVRATGTLTAPAIDKGVAGVEVDYDWPYSDSSTFAIDLYVNDTKVDSASVTGGTAGTASFAFAAVSGPATVKFVNTSTSVKKDRLIFDTVRITTASKSVAKAVGDVVYSNNVGNVTSFDVTGLQPNTEYTFAFRAIAGDEATEWSEPVSVKTADGPAAPAWTAIPAQSAAVGYPFSIDLSAYVSGVPTPALTLTAGAAELTGTVLSFTPAAVGDYTFTVTASNSSGDPADATVTVSAIEHVPTKYAVCVGINKYEEISGLSGCVNDSIYIENSLIERGGWAAENVVRLNDKQATKAAIRKAISDVAAKAQAGDTFVYQHSSHGGQFNDTTGEIITDETGKAVFLCVYDEIFDDNTTAYNDYEIAADMAAFNAGVKVAVIVDACHSGGLFKSKEEARAAAASFDLAGRVTAIMDADRAQRKARGENVAKTLASSEIGWATACEYYETSYDGGFYHTDEWLTNNVYGDEYWNETTEEYNYPASYKQGGVFTASAAWGWWNGTADADPEAGDNDGFCDVYEFWKKGYDFCSVVGEFWWEDSEYNYYPQCTNIAVLKSVELGWVVDPRLPAPENPEASSATASSFVASWDAVEGAASYNLYVQKKLADGRDVDADVILKEDFAGFTGAENTEISKLDDVTAVPGWSGEKVYPADGTAKLGSSKASGWIATPAVDLPAGAVVSATVAQYGSDTGKISIDLSTDDGATWTPLCDEFSPAAAGETVSMTLAAEAKGAMIRFAVSAKRFYLDDVVITGKPATWVDVEGYAPANVAGTSKEVTGLEMGTEYRYTVTAIDDEGVESVPSERVNVTTAEEDTAPIWSDIPEQSAVAGQVFTFKPADYVKASPAATITVTGSSLADGEYAFADGILTFTPAAEGTCTFDFQAANTLGVADATLTVVAAAAPVTVPELTLSNPTADSFKAEWTACTGASSYQFQVATDDQFTSGSAGGTFTLVESDDDLTAGDYVILAANVDTAMKNACSGDASGYLSCAEVTVSGTSVSTEDAAIIWTLAGDATSFTLYNSDAGKYVNPTTTKATVGWSATAAGSWTFSVSDGIATVANVDNDSWKLQYNSGAPRFTCYNSAQQKLRFFRRGAKSVAKDGGSLVLDETTSGLTYTAGGLEPDTTYYARVRMAEGDWSEVKSIDTEADVPVVPAWSEIPVQTVVAGENLVLDLTAYVSGSPKPTITADAGTVEAGVLTVSYAEAGEYTIALTAENSEGTAPATLAVTVTAAPVTVPVLALSNPTANSFDASWTECTGVSSYTLQVSTAEFKGVRDGDAILSEDFAKCDGSDTNGGDITSKLDQYTDRADWSGFKVFEAAGRIKLGTSSTNGYIVTPAVDIPAGAALTCKIAQYGSDTGTVDIQLSANGGEFASLLDEAVKPASDGETITVNFAEAVPGAKIKFVSSAKRFYLDDVVIAGSGGGSSVMTFTVEGTFKTVDGLEPETTYYACVKGAADWSEVQSITTLPDVPTAPEWQEIPAQTATVGVEFSIDLSTYVTGSPFPTITVDGTVAEGGNWSFTPTAAGEFTFELVATNTEGSDSATLTVVVSEAPPAPVTVPELTLSNATETSFDAAWTECTDATGYQLQVATDDQFSTGGTGETTVVFSNAATSVEAPENWTYEIGNASGSYLQLKAIENQVVSAPVSTVGYASLKLSFRLRTFGGVTNTSDTAVLAYSTDGETWKELGSVKASSSSLTAQSVDASASAGLASVRYRWTCPGAESGKGVGIDRLVLSGESAGEGGSIILDETTSDLAWTVEGLASETTYYARVRMAGGEWSEVKSIKTAAGSGEPVKVDIAEVTIDAANRTLSFTVPDGATVMTTSDLVNGAWVPYEGEWPIPMTGGPAFFRIGNPPERD